MDEERGRPTRRNFMKKELMQSNADDCPELVLAALEDATIELAYIKQLIVTIADSAEHLQDLVLIKAASEELQ